MSILNRNNKSINVTYPLPMKEKLDKIKRMTIANNGGEDLNWENTILEWALFYEHEYNDGR